MSSLIFTAGSNDTLALIIFLVVTAIIITLVILISVHNKKLTNFVKENSDYIKEIDRLNKKYQFGTVSRTNDSHTFHLSSKRQFDTFDYFKKGQQYIISNVSYYAPIVKTIQINRTNQKKYQEELKTVKHTTDEEVALNGKMKLKNFVKRETKIGSKMIKNPIVNYTIDFIWEYTSPAGRNHYSRSCTFNFGSIESTIYNYQQSKIAKTTTTTTVPPRSCTPPKKAYSLDDIEDCDD